MFHARTLLLTSCDVFTKLAPRASFTTSTLETTAARWSWTRNPRTRSRWRRRSGIATCPRVTPARIISPRKWSSKVHRNNCRKHNEAGPALVRHCFPLGRQHCSATTTTTTATTTTSTTTSGINKLIVYWSCYIWNWFLPYSLSLLCIH